MSLSDDYQLLELEPNANEAQAKASYRRLAKLYHPDKNPHRDTTETFQNLQVAYQNVLNAIRQGVIVQDWKAFDFDSSSFNKTTQSTTNDNLQYAYIKERQKAYDELKRNSAKHEKARQNAIRNARNTLNEKRVKKMYEEAFKASQASEAFRQYTDNHQSHASADQQVDDFIHQYQPEPPIQQTVNKHASSYDTYSKDATADHLNTSRYPIKTSSIKMVFLAVSYLLIFSFGVFGTLYWQSVYQPKTQVSSNDTTYIPGMYPQLRQGLNYTLLQTNLYLAPNIKSKAQIIVPAGVDVIASQLTTSDWVAIRYQDIAGWVQGKTLGFGGIEHAQNTGCYGHPGQVPEHGEVSGQHKGTSRLRILNSLATQSILTFESYDGLPTFSIFLHAGQPFATNVIPRGQYRLVLETGSLYHRACNQFLFNQTSKVVMEGIQFSSAEQSLTLTQ